MPPLRVAFALDDSRGEAARRRVLELAARLDRTRFAPEIWMLRPRDGSGNPAPGPDHPLRDEQGAGGPEDARTDGGHQASSRACPENHLPTNHLPENQPQENHPVENPPNEDHPEENHPIELTPEDLRKSSPRSNAATSIITREAPCSFGAHSAWALWKLSRREKPDVVVLADALANAWGRVAARLALGRGVRIIAIRRCGDGLSRWRERLLRPFVDHYIVNAAAMRETLLANGAAPERVTLIHDGASGALGGPGVADTAASGAASGGRTPKAEGLVLLGSAHPAQENDPATLLQAWARVEGMHPSSRLALIGAAPSRRLLDQARDLGLAGRVDFKPDADATPDSRAMPDKHADKRARSWEHGQSDDQRAKETGLWRGDIFVLAGAGEDAPRAALEAMARGLPVIAPQQGAMTDLATHGVTGRLVTPGDPDALALAMLNLMEDAHARSRFGRAAREKAAQEHSLDAMARAYEQVIEKAAAGE